jgi:molecular chaperone GrpE
MSATRPTGKSDARPDAAEGMASGGAEAESRRVAELEARIAELEAELAGVKDRLLRALAEQENSRRRAARERDEAVKFAESGLARDLLSTIGDLGRARNSVPEEKMADETVQKLLTGIASSNVGCSMRWRSTGSVGSIRWASRSIPTVIRRSSKRQMPNVRQLQPGYPHHDRLLRPAMVGVVGGGSAMAAERGAAEPAGDDEAV